MLLCNIYCHQKKKYYINTLPFNNWTQHAEKCDLCRKIQLLQKGVIGKRMLKVKAAQKGRPKIDVKDLLGLLLLLTPFFPQIESDTPSAVKLDDFNNTDINSCITLSCFNSCGEKLKEIIKLLKYQHRFCLNYLASCLSSKSSNAQHAKQILKADISPSSDLQNLLSLLKMQCKICNKKFLISAYYNYYTKHIHNCLLDVSSLSSYLVTDIFNISENNIPKSVEDAT